MYRVADASELPTPELQEQAKKLLSQTSTNPARRSVSQGLHTIPCNPIKSIATGNEGHKKAKNKYHVSPPEDRTYNGIKYASKKEMRKAQELDLQKETGEITYWLRQVSFDLPGGDKYVADFQTYTILTPVWNFPYLWEITIIEVKGFWTPLAKNKFKRFKNAYPLLNIEVV